MLPKGWSGLYVSLIKDLDTLAPNVEILSAGVQFGTLNVVFRTDNLTDKQIEFINARLGLSEKISTQTCAECGEHADLYHKNMLVRPLCPNHHTGWQSI